LKNLDAPFNNTLTPSVLRWADENSKSNFFAQQFSEEQLILLAGAPEGATVTAKKRISWLPEGMDEYVAQTGKNAVKPTEGLVLTTVHQLIRSRNEVVLYTEGLEDLCIFIQNVDFLPENNKGTGGKFIANIVNAARSCSDSFRWMRLEAVGGRLARNRPSGLGRWVGYAAWPKYGFDMKINGINEEFNRFFPYFPRDIQAADTVQALLAIEGGARHWQATGVGSFMSFDLDRNSKSSVILDKWADENGILMIKKSTTGFTVPTDIAANFSLTIEKKVAPTEGNAVAFFRFPDIILTNEIAADMGSRNRQNFAETPDDLI
jgi:hypothetical protein